MPPTPVVIARGTTPEERQRSIDTIKHWIELHDPHGITADALQAMYDMTEDTATTWIQHQQLGAYLCVDVGRDTACDRQGPDDPVAKGCTRAANADNANLVVESLAVVPVDFVTDLLTEHGVHVYDARHQITLNPNPSRDNVPVATRRAIEVLGGTAEHADALLAGIEWGGGRPPLGTTSDDGRLTPADDYDRVCRALQKVQDGQWSKTKAASKLDCARKTIDNALDRPGLYRLE